ncbi:Methyltransferase-like protein 16 [Desmophyllum pertusum]|uniref:U6 small nuclear RNA (adenine-(43)-N(6))-methyltransferase n=1 Tax=Desmophyllum pertusum TaxID=174260 RepID=A0A9W9ZX44_9CNID|nr:Methyltransferase-like protein 16 [Desmophyllum pertusum]
MQAVIVITMHILLLLVLLPWLFLDPPINKEHILTDHYIFIECKAYNLVVGKKPVPGSGASCIYPLLGAKLNNWHFLATEVDELSVSYAKDNVKCNGLESNIRVKEVTHGSFLKKPLEDEDTKEFDFCMCNPPFFISEFEASHGIARSDKRPQPSGVCTGTETETVTGGGEVEFVKEIIKDSLFLKEQVSWYTTMLGKKSSLAPVLACLRENGIKTVTSTEFCQGQTMRWGVAWSFLPGVTVQDSPSKRRKRAKKTKPLHFVIPDELAATHAGSEKQAQMSDKVTAIGKYVKEILNELKVTAKEQKKADKSRGILAFHCHACEITWAHQRRKRRENLGKGVPQENTGDCQPGRVDEAAKQRVGDTSNNMEIQEACEEDNNEEKNVSSTDEALTSSDVCTSEMSDSQECPSASVSNDPQKDASVSRPLMSFTVRVGIGTEMSDDLPGDGVVLEMTWIAGQNKNDLYQLFQFFQNKLLKGF